MEKIIGVHKSKLQEGSLVGIVLGRDYPASYIPTYGDDFGLYDVDDESQTVVAYGLVTCISSTYKRETYVELTTQDEFYTILRRG